MPKEDQRSKMEKRVSEKRIKEQILLIEETSGELLNSIQIRERRKKGGRNHQIERIKL